MSLLSLGCTRGDLRLFNIDQNRKFRSESGMQTLYRRAHSMAKGMGAGLSKTDHSYGSVPQN
jgi:hypothetical protein